MRKGIIVVVIAVFALPTLASQPGHPLDCSDWVFTETGYSCTALVAFPGRDASGGRLSTSRPGNNHRALDNVGQLLMVKYNVPTGEFCGTYELTRTEVSRIHDGAEQVTGYVKDRCVDPVSHRTDRVSADNGEVNGGEYTGAVLFDAVLGRLVFTMTSTCEQSPPEECPFGGGWQLTAIDGFSPLFDILQTYTPTADALQFRVPAHPEGLRSADHFDTYWGHVSDLPDFTQAQPMACAFPADHQPQAGEYLTVADTSPRPTAGTVNYIVTAVTNGSQRRYGRQRIGGMLSGRDPALLPGCP